MFPQEIQSYLDSFINFENNLNEVASTEFKLERVQALLELLDNPHKKLKAIHVAGSKGKGSVCSMIAAILSEKGFKVGLYTSPHIYHMRERIRILSQERYSQTLDSLFPDSISNDDIVRVVDSIKPAVEKIRAEKSLGRLTFYEVFTVVALLHFAQQKVDYVVLETGLGGRLDATNVVNAQVVVITPISLEHTKILGDTLAQIAQEKAGIIKQGAEYVFLMPQEAEAMEVLIDQCEKLKKKPLFVRNRVKTNLLGEHQEMNAAAAKKAVQVLDVMSRREIEAALQKVKWPCRFEIIQRDPMIILDAAHNAASARVLVNTFQKQYPDRKAHLILGMSSDKEKAEFCKVLTSITNTVTITKANHPRVHTFSQVEIKEYFPGITSRITDSVEKAREEVFNNSSHNDIILVCGSLFVASEFRKTQESCHVSV